MIISGFIFLGNSLMIFSDCLCLFVFFVVCLVWALLISQEGLSSFAFLSGVCPCAFVIFFSFNILTLSKKKKKIEFSLSTHFLPIYSVYRVSFTIHCAQLVRIMIMKFLQDDHKCVSFTPIIMDLKSDSYNSRYSLIIHPYSTANTGVFHCNICNFKNSQRLHIKSNNSHFWICYTSICLVFPEFYRL